MRYTPSSRTDREAMLRDLGIAATDDLFASVPTAHRTPDPLRVEGPVPEADLLRRIAELKGPRPRVSLVGGGLYDHYIPPTVDSICARSEWVTSYTPYQPELAQGTLVMYWEVQTWVALLTGQEIANGGMYDGSTALAEAVLMARRLRPKARLLHVSAALHPEYRAVLRTYLRWLDVELVTLPLDPATGTTRLDLTPEEQREALAIVVQSPNFLGAIEDPRDLDPDAFLIGVCTEAQSLALLPPLPVTVAVGEMQSLGIPMQLGGPTAGFLATARANVRQMPGRLVARTLDRDGKEAWCITLATREQFIRREKATSNICTSSGLMCLRSVVYLSLLGSGGLRSEARKSARAARAFAAGLAEVGLPRIHSAPCFNEFVVDARQRPGLVEALRDRGFLLGLPLGRWYPELEGHVLVALTERQYPIVADLIQEVKDVAHRS